MIKKIKTSGVRGKHMAHPFNLTNLTKGDHLVRFFKDASRAIDENKAVLKIDGLNVSFRPARDEHGDRCFVLDRGSMKPLDVAGVGKSDLVDRFGEGHGMVSAGTILLTIFNEAGPLIEDELTQLGFNDNPNLYFNTEYVVGKTNVVDYNTRLIAIHGVNEYYKVTDRRRGNREVEYDQKILDQLVEKVHHIAKRYMFSCITSIPVEFERSLHFENFCMDNLRDTLTIHYTRSEQISHQLGTWLNQIENPFEAMITFDGKKTGAMSKKVYTTLVDGGGIVEELIEDPKEWKLAVDGAVLYHATTVLGREFLSLLTCSAGRVSDHEGIVLRDEERFGPQPVKITGDFILKGMESKFQTA